MRRGVGQALRVGVSGSAVCLLRTSRWGGEAVSVLAEQAFLAPPGQLHEALGPALAALFGAAAHAGWPVSFVLDDALARLWQVTPPPGAAHLADLEAAAALRFCILYGEPMSDWNTAAEWDAAQPFYAAAVPRALLAVLQRSAGEHGLAVVGVAPHFIDAWNRWCGALKAGAWFGLMHDKVLSIAAIDGKRLRAVRAVPLPQGADHAWLSAVLRREALLLDVEAPTLLQVCGQMPPALRQPVANPAQIACVALAAAGPGALSLAARLALGGRFA